MTDGLVRLPSEYLAQLSPEAAVAFRNLRNAVQASGPLDHQTCELILISGLAIRGFEYAFKVHASRLLQGGTAKAALQQAVACNLAAANLVYEVARALQWIEEIEAEGKTY